MPVASVAAFRSALNTSFSGETHVSPSRSAKRLNWDVPCLHTLHIIKIKGLMSHSTSHRCVSLGDSGFS